MMSELTSIEILPNEILISILTTFRTIDLLPITLTSQRIHALIIRILHHRLLETAKLQDHKLILECFHPATKLSTPYLFCSYIDTHALNPPTLNPNPFENDSPVGKLAQLNSLYSHFLPLKPSSDRTRVRSHPAGGLFSIPNGLVDDHEKFVCQNIHLDSLELFSQLQTITSLVKVGPKRGLFLSSVNIGDSVLRIWREWLGVRAKVEKGLELGDEGESGAGAKSSGERLLWADNHKVVGLKLRVIEREEDAPVLVRKDEDPPVSYTLQYEELVIKTSQLLLLVEESIDQEVNHSGQYCGLDGIYGLNPTNWYWR
ncbi:hypothetical protein VTL71DRAFT_6879 [Oculimacula yallundae]|uniref:F-box domain-containing protein n=1 Tax=Oculimacula yallundae TaxID=86028 RepID=A0ABR4BVX2_9HELO